MLLSKGKKIIFLHSPKTAGTSIAQALRSRLSVVEMGGKRRDWDFHTSIKSFEERLPNLDDFFIFTFVRNPWDRQYSWYSMLARNNGIKVTNESFKKWLLEGNHDMSSAFPEGHPKVSAQRFSQIYYMKDSTGTNRVGFIGKFENLNEYFSRLCNELDMNGIALPFARKGNHKPYFEAYDEECIQFVREYHKDDIETFGYTFPR